MNNQRESNTESTVLITGASSGIGNELAKVFARNGHNLVIVARNQKRLDQLADELREKHRVKVIVLPKDLSINTSPQEIYETLQKGEIQIDILVNNAGLIV